MNNSIAENGNIVSFDDETLILVDENDQVIGHGDKYDIHLDKPQRHRAFSILLFNSKGELLLQQRSQKKPLWPLYWSNSCCSHPRKGEGFEEATKRRLQEELGLEAPLQYIYKFEYEIDYKDDNGETVGTEHEICRVFVGVCDETPQPNPSEVASWRYMSAEAINEDLKSDPQKYTPWFQMEWRALTKDHQDELDALVAA